MTSQETLNSYSEYNDSVETAIQIFRQIVPVAARHTLALNPIVYTVLYQYVARLNPDLSERIDTLISEDGLTQETVESLYQTHIYANDLENTRSINMAVGNLILFTQGAIHRIEDDTEQYSEHLTSATRLLNSPSSEQGMQSLIATLLTETQNMREASSNLRSELNDANQKIDKMNQEFHRIRHESLTDPLTGLKNRRAFDRDIAKTLAAAKVAQEPLSLLLVDIDHFKSVNDTHGHMLGDGVIKRIAQWLTETVRGNDVVARFGGEEFVLILPKTDLQGATSVAENVRNNISKHTLRHGKKLIGKITVSIGAAQAQHDETADDLIDRADQALYQAKRNGRNQVVAG